MSSQALVLALDLVVFLQMRDHLGEAGPAFLWIPHLADLVGDALPGIGEADRRSDGEGSEQLHRGRLREDDGSRVELSGQSWKEAWVVKIKLRAVELAAI